MNTADAIKNALEFAPKDATKHALGLLGWLTPEDDFVCSICYGRVVARGCHYKMGAPVWEDKATEQEKQRPCKCCGHKGQA